MTVEARVLAGSSTDEIAQLAGLAQELGGRIREIDSWEWLAVTSDADYYQGPYMGRYHARQRLGVLWRRKEIVHCGSVSWPDVLHDMGHVFACPRPPDEADEYWYLGWECAVVRRLGLDEFEWIEATTGFPELRMAGYADARLGDAIARGLVAPDGSPRSIR